MEARASASTCVDSVSAPSDRLGAQLGVSVSRDPELERLISAWPALDGELRRALLRLAESGARPDACV
jgi:hypothetical protein